MAEAVLLLDNRMKCSITFHQICDVFFFGDRPFGYPLTSVFSAAFLRIKIQIIFSVFLLADTALYVRIAAHKISLHHLNGVCMILFFQQRSIRHGNQVFVLAQVRHAFTNNIINSSDCAVDFVFEIHRVIYHPHVRMGAPCS